MQRKNMVQTSKFVTSLNTAFTWITKVTCLNLLWIIYSFIGLIVGGIFPATVATLRISQKWLTGQKDIKLIQTFSQYYKREFIGSNIIGWIVSIVGILLFANFKIMENMAEDLNFVTIFSFYLLIFIYFSSIIWIFPLVARHKGTIIQYMKNAFVIGLGKIHITF